MVYFLFASSTGLPEVKVVPPSFWAWLNTDALTLTVCSSSLPSGFSVNSMRRT